jgi:hypothetical protein
MLRCADIARVSQGISGYHMLKANAFYYAPVSQPCIVKEAGIGLYPDDAAEGGYGYQSQKKPG